ncbi:IS5 family transposase [Kitasatospora phosalacinea]|uniref:IS5 family transposase n=1 Tax=Kitasatospora phosalacinea TaxID=2065 RepID=UPI0036460155
MPSVLVNAPPQIPFPGPAASACRHPRYGEPASPACGIGAQAPNQRSANASEPGDTTFSIMVDKGRKSCRAGRPGTPLRGHENGNGGEATGPSPVDRRKSGSKHHLISDGGGIPFHVITTAANVNDVTRTLDLVDGIPPVAGRVGRPRKRPDALLGDKGYDSNPNRRELRRRRILPVISRRGEPDIIGRGKLSYVVEQTFAQLHQFKRLAIRWERRLDLHNAFVSLACALICWRRLNRQIP